MAYPPVQYDAQGQPTLMPGAQPYIAQPAPLDPNALLAQYSAQLQQQQQLQLQQQQSAPLMPTATAPLMPSPLMPAATVPTPGVAAPADATQPAVNPAVASAAAPAPPTSEADKSTGNLFIAVHDWTPDQQGQLKVKKGQLIYISYEAAHGWVYGTVRNEQSPADPNGVTAEGWVPKAVAKRVSLCQAIADWTAEGGGTLSVTKGDWMAISREADRGWVYGERVGPSKSGDSTAASDGWLPKKVLEYVQV